MNFRATHDGRRNGIELRPCGRDRMVLIGGQMGGLGRLDGWGMTMSRRTVSRITASSICRVVAAVGEHGIVAHFKGKWASEKRRFKKQERRTNNIESTGRPAAAKGGSVPPLR